jgi:hypothetical protein
MNKYDFEFTCIVILKRLFWFQIITFLLNWHEIMNINVFGIRFFYKIGVCRFICKIVLKKQRIRIYFKFQFFC